jgi:hypothetical protein
MLLGFFLVFLPALWHHQLVRSFPTDIRQLVLSLETMHRSGMMSGEAPADLQVSLVGSYSDATLTSWRYSRWSHPFPIILALPD